MRRAMMLVSVSLVAACAGAKPADTTADVAAIGTLRDQYATAWKAGDAAALGALFAADGRSMENQQPTAVGPQGMQAATAEFLKLYAPSSFDITSEKVDVAGDLAYDRGTFKVTATPKAPGVPALADSGRYIAIARRQSDGSWKLMETIVNSATPPPMPGPVVAGKPK